MSGSMVSENGLVPTQAGTDFGNGLAAGIVATPADQVGVGSNGISRTISTAMETFSYSGGAKALMGTFRAPIGQNTFASSTAAQNIGSGGTTPVTIYSLRAHTALAASVQINGVLNSTGGSTSYTVPAGVVGDLLTPGEHTFASGASIVLSTASDGPRLMARWGPLNDKLRIVINASSSSDASGKLDTDGAFDTVYVDQPFVMGFARDGRATRVDVRREYGGATPAELVLKAIV